ncbi:MAG: DUF4434 domain-containing protein [Ignavibacteriaceae bacterium]|nr:DUF4434 domain-containing protein [Ignavibacteriaceae bacterium]
MKKNINKKNLNPFVIILLLFFMLLSNAGFAGASKAVADGSFVQAWLCGSWTDARWQQEFTAMKNAGMHYLVIGPVAESAAGQTTKTLYPSSLPNTVLDSGLNGKDMVDVCLRNAQAAGIKVFIAISSNDLWWSAHGSDTTWFYNQMKFDNTVCDEVYSLYKSKYPDTFYGWYWAYEVDNASFATDAEQNELITGMNIQLDHLTAANIKLPFMWCPFMNSKLGTSQAYQALWENVFSKLHITTGDIFCPQDCVGAGGLDISQVPEWFAALRKAVDTKSGLLFWSDVETFVQSDWTSATIDRVVKQLKDEQPYVDNYITFAYCHYDSPYNLNPGFHNTYVDYFNNGVLESTPPSVPANFTATVKANGTVNLSWDASTDNIGICGYYIYRNGVQIKKEQVPVLNGGTGTPLATTFSDQGLSANTNYTYQVKAYDFANNTTATDSVTVNSGEIALLTNKISVGCSYTVSIPADSIYPDSNNKELTNGSFARINSKGDPAWEGVYDVSKTQRDIIINVGRSKLVQQFAGYFLYDSYASIYLPAQVKVSVSSNGTSFTDVGYLSIPTIAVGTAASSVQCVCTLTNGVYTSYVKFSVTPGGSWTFDDEYEVRNGNATGVEETNNVPKEYALMQNYPNPFNPSTVIRYQIAKEGNVTLKIYNMLGKEVKTLVNEKREAGSYSIDLNASTLPSGVYFYRIISGSYSDTKKMILLK